MLVGLTTGRQFVRYEILVDLKVFQNSLLLGFSWHLMKKWHILSYHNLVQCILMGFLDKVYYEVCWGGPAFFMSFLPSQFLLLSVIRTGAM